MILQEVGIFVLGVVTGAGLIRYGIRLGTNIMDKAKRDEPLWRKDESVEPMDSHTDGRTMTEEE